MEANKTSLTTEALTPAGYERLENGEARNLQLVQGTPLEFILGKNHKVVLKRGDNGSVAISIDDANLFHPASGNGSTKTDELRFPAGSQVAFYRASALAEIQSTKLDFKDNGYFVELPDKAVNFRDEQIDFTDLAADAHRNLLIVFGRPSPIAPNVTQVEITNGHSTFGVAVPAPQAEQELLLKEELMTQIDMWKRLAEAEKAEGENPLADELMAMAGDPEIKMVYENFMKQKGADKNTAMIVAVAAFLYKEQLNAMGKEKGKEKFVAMVKGIKAAIAIGS